MKRYIAALLLACCVEGYAQEKKQAAFVPPFDFPLTLSGNFGEIRSNHFHGGLDFKTGGTIGKPVRALADGYISQRLFHYQPPFERFSVSHCRKGKETSI